MTEKRFIHCDENENITILTEENLPKCPKTNGISPKVWIIGEKKRKQNIPVKHLNCRCAYELKGDDE